MTTEESFEMPDARGPNVIEGLSHDPFKLLHPVLVHLCDDVHTATLNRDPASSVVVETQQHPAGNVQHESPPSFLTG